MERAGLYLGSCAFSALLVVAVAAVAFPVAPTPLEAFQLMYLFVAVDLLPALALGFRVDDDEAEGGDGDLPTIAGRVWPTVALFVLMAAGAVLGVFYIAYFKAGFSDGRTVSIVFLSLGIAHLGHVIHMRPTGTSRWNNRVTRAPPVWAALAVGAAALAATASLPPVVAALGLANPGNVGWVAAAITGALPTALGFLRP